MIKISQQVKSFVLKDFPRLLHTYNNHHNVKVKLVDCNALIELSRRAAPNISSVHEVNHGPCFSKKPTGYESDRNTLYCPQQSQGETDVLFELHGHGKIYTRPFLEEQRS